jgi:tetratricopeptide (TPR) repeat protein
MRILLLCIAILPGFAGVRELGAELEAAGRWEDAARLYRATLDQSPPTLADRFWLLTSLAEIDFNRQDYDAAERWLHQAEQLGQPSGRPRLLAARGTLHLVRGNLTAAQRDLSQALDLTTADAPPEDRAAVLHNLAAVEMQIGHLTDAENHQRQALGLWRGRLGDRHDYVLKAWIGLSSVQGLREEWSAAAESLRRALAIRESDEALANYAVVLEKLKRRKEAKAIRARLHAPPSVVSPLIDVNAPGRPAVRSR